MKHLYLLISSLIMLVGFHYPTNIAQLEDPYFINSFEEDITGDGFREYIRLEGNLFHKNGDYFHNVWVNIQTPFTQQWKIPLVPGYDPKLHIIDVTNDNRHDLLYQVAKDSSRKRFDYLLYTFTEGRAEQILLPQPGLIQGNFKDDYKLEISMDVNTKPLSIDLGHKKGLYNNLYNADGKLIIQKKIQIHPIYFFEPRWMSDKKGNGIVSSQHVKASGESDILGEIRTLWYFERGKWVVESIEWVQPSIY